MDKFWKWMKENNYSSLSYIFEDIIDAFGNIIVPTKQMMIGYMIEYIRNHEFWHKNQDEEEYKNFQLSFMMSVISQDAYFSLRDIIELLELKD